MDKIVDKIAALGVPGLVMVAAISATGFAGGAAVTTALAALGGPFGMLGGIGLLLVLALASKGVTQYGFERIFKGTVDRLYAKGMKKEEIRRKIETYPLSRSLKLMILDRLESIDA